MKKLILLAALVFSTASFSQYCAFYDFQVNDPEKFVSTLTKMMNTEWGKSIQGTKSLFQFEFNGTGDATHSVNFCFQDEAALQNFMASFGQSQIVQLLAQTIGDSADFVSQSLNTPAWYQNDWSNDQVFLFWQVKVSDPATYASAFIPFSKKMMKKMNITNSHGLGYPILGKNKEFTHFIWSGADDVATAINRVKQLYSDPETAKFSKQVDGIREIINTFIMIRVADF